MDSAPPRPAAEVENYLASAPALPPPWQPPLEERRKEQSKAILRNSGQLQSVADTEDVDADGIPTRIYRPSGDERTAFVWLHGGGWVFHDIETYDPLARALASASGAAVVSVDYRRPPEHPFPAAVNDAATAVKWAAEEYETVAVGGDSAGANLAAVASQRARDERIDVALQVLAYPILDYRVESDGYRRHVERYKVFARIDDYGAAYHDAIKWLWDQYVSNPIERTDPNCSPLRALSVEGVAPAFIITAEHDILRPEAEEYARRLAAEGVLVELYEFKGQVHGFLDALGILQDARLAVNMIGERLRESLSQ